MYLHVLLNLNPVFSFRMIHGVFFVVLPLFLSGLVKGEWPGNETVWHPCSAYCNCSLLDDALMARCDLQMMDNCESFVLPNDTLIL